MTVKTNPQRDGDENSDKRKGNNNPNRNNKRKNPSDSGGGGDDNGDKRRKGNEGNDESSDQSENQAAEEEMIDPFYIANMLDNDDFNEFGDVIDKLFSSEGLTNTDDATGIGGTNEDAWNEFLNLAPFC